MTDEFPKIEQTITERKEILERELPRVLSDILSRIIIREVEKRFTFYSKSGDPAVANEIRALNLLDPEAAAGRLTRDIKRDERRLETLALLDVGEWEYGRLMAGLSRDLSAAEYGSEESEGLKLIIKMYGARREKVRLERDWLLEEESALRIFASKEEFMEWARDLRERSEARRRIDKTKDLEGAESQKLQEELLRKIEAGGALSSRELELLNSLLELEINRTRVLASSEVTKYLLNSADYSKEQLLGYEKKIIKFRQFLVNVNAGEWVSLMRRK